VPATALTRDSCTNIFGGRICKPALLAEIVQEHFPQHDPEVQKRFATAITATDFYADGIDGQLSLFRIDFQQKVSCKLSLEPRSLSAFGLHGSHVLAIDVIDNIIGSGL
jgi:hypothetical protein